MSFAPSDLVLVTGANGHVAQHLIDQLLNLPNHPRVRGTVRSEAKAAEIRRFYAGDEDRLQIVVVENITESGAFDSAIKGATHVAHVASPIIIDQNDVEKNVLQPAIAGTTTILESAHKEASVRKVVITSSFGAVADISHGWRPDYTYTENDFNPFRREDALDQNLNLPKAEPIHLPFVSYITSKVLAEKAAWEAAKSARFKLSVILPTYIFGPSILPLPKGGESFSFSNALLWKTATANGAAYIPMDWPYMVDVRDVARAHVLALTKKEADGQRFLCNSQKFYYSAIADVVRQRFPTLSPASGQPQEFKHYSIDNTKSLKVLGLGSYIPFEQSVVDTLRQVVG